MMSFGVRENFTENYDYFEAIKDASDHMEQSLKTSIDQKVFIILYYTVGSQLIALQLIALFWLCDKLGHAYVVR